MRKSGESGFRAPPLITVLHCPMVLNITLSVSSIAPSFQANVTGVLWALGCEDGDLDLLHLLAITS